MISGPLARLYHVATTKQIESRARLLHQSDVNEIILLFSLGVLMLWTIGPFGAFIAYHVPPLRKILGLDP